MRKDAQIVGLPSVGGIDTRSDPLQVRPPKMSALQNVSMRSPGSYQKRNGMARLANPGMMGTARAILVRNDQPTLINDGGWLQTLGNVNGSSAWNTVGRFPVVGVTTSGVGVVSVFSDSVVIGSNTYVACEYIFAGSSQHQLVILVYGPTMEFTGVSYLVHVTLGADRRKPRLLAIGNQLVLMFVVGTQIGFVKITTGNPDPSNIGTQVVIPTLLVSDLNATTPVFDAEEVNGRIYLAYNSSTANTIKHGLVNVNGAVEVGFNSIATTGNAIAIGVATHPVSSGPGSGDVAVVWARDTGTAFEVQWFTEPSLSAVFAVTAMTTSLPGAVRNVTAAFEGAVGSRGNLIAYVETAGASADLNKVSMSKVTSAGSVSTTLGWMPHSGLGSKAWSDFDRSGSDLFPSVSAVILTHESALQSGYHIVQRDTDPRIIGNLFPAQGIGLITTRHLPRISNIGRTYVTSLMWRSSPAAGFTPVVARMDFEATIDHVQAGQSLYVPSAALMEHDGRRTVEAGFLLFPEGTTGVSSNAGGSLLASTSYSYRVFFEYVNANGERTVSSTGDVVTLSTGVGHNTITLTLQTLAASNRILAVFAIYRKEQSADLYHRVSSGDTSSDSTLDNGVRFCLSLDNSGADSITFVDKMSEAVLLTKELSPITGGLIDNIAPAANRIIAAGNGRVFLAGFHDPNMIWYSKSRETFEPLAFSDQLQIAVEQGRGPITALATLEDILVIFRYSQIYVTGGAGLDNSGSGSPFTVPRLVADNVGCANPRSICTIPGALLFQGARGFYSYGNADGVQYVGADVEDFNDQTVLSAVAVSEAHEARFVMSGGRTLVYDYLARQWGEWTNPSIDARRVGGDYVSIKDKTGVALVETDGYALDDGLPYTMVIEYPWLHAQALQGAQRIIGILMAGKYRGRHLAVVKIGYDLQDGFAEIREWDPVALLVASPSGYGGAAYGVGVYGGNAASGVPATTVYQFLIRPKRQRCSTIKIRIEDAGYPGDVLLQDSFSISELALEVVPIQSHTRLGTMQKAP